MPRIIKYSMVVGGSIIASAIVYGILALLYGLYGVPEVGAFRYVLPEVRPLVALFYVFPLHQPIPSVFFVAFHIAEAFLLFFMLFYALRYLSDRKIRFTVYSFIIGSCVLFGVTLLHVLLNNATIAILFEGTGYGPLMHILGPWLSIIPAVIVSIFLTPLTFLYLLGYFLVAAKVANVPVSLKSILTISVTWLSPKLNMTFKWWKWAYLFTLFNFFSVILADVLFKSFVPVAFIIISTYLGIIATVSVLLGCSLLKAYQAPSDRA